MGTVATKFTGDPQQLLEAYNKIYSANVKLSEQMATHTRQAHKDHSELAHQLSHEIGSLKSLAIGYFSIHKALDGVSDAYGRIKERMREVADGAKTTAGEINRVVVATGEAANAKLISERLAKMKGLSGDEASRLYGMVSEGADSTVGFERRLTLTRAMAKYTPYLPPEDEDAIARTAGQLANLDKNASPQKLIGRAVNLNQAPGGQQLLAQKGGLGAISKLVARGMSIDDATALGLQFAEKGGAAQFKQIIDLTMDEAYKPPQTKGRTRLTAEEAAKMRFSKTPAGLQRLELLRRDPQLAGYVGADEALLRQLDDRHFQELAARQRAAGNADLPRQMMKSQQGREAFRLALDEERARSLNRALSGPARDEEAFRKEIQVELDSRWARREFFAWGSGQLADYSQPPSAFRHPDPMFNQFGEAAQRAIAARNFEEGYQRIDPASGQVTPEGKARDAAALQEMKLTNQKLDRMIDLQSHPGAAPVRNVNER